MPGMRKGTGGTRGDMRPPIPERLRAVELIPLLRTMNIHLAVRAAIAAWLAWLPMIPLSGFADRYQYYAPLGALITVSATVVGSAREAVASIASIVVGAVFGVGFVLLDLPEIVGVPLAVGLGTMVGAWWVFGEMRTWVPITALLVLINAHAMAVDFSLTYLALTSFGAVVGVVVVMLAPLPPPLAPLHGVNRARSDLAEDIAELADRLRGNERDQRGAWSERRRRLASRVEEVRQQMWELEEARRVNWRARQPVHSAEARQRIGYAQALEQTALAIQVIEMVMPTVVRDGEPYPLLTDQANTRLLRVLDALVAELRTEEITTAVGEEARAAVADLLEYASGDIRDKTSQALTAMAVALDHAVEAWAQ